jgi:hypothetical protein
LVEEIKLEFTALACVFVLPFPILDLLIGEANHLECGDLSPPCLAKFISRHLPDGINSVIKGGNKLPQSKCEFRNSQKRELHVVRSFRED